MSVKHPICPVCEAGELTPIVYRDTFNHHGAEVFVEGLEGYRCAACGADPVLQDQIRRNHRRVVDAKRAADGLLTGPEIQALRKELRLTQKDASEVFGGGANAFSKYERGDVMQSIAMDKLLCLIGRHPYLLPELRGEKALPEDATANEPQGYVNGKPLHISGTAQRSPVLDGRSTVVEMDEWKAKRAA